MALIPDEDGKPSILVTASPSDEDYQAILAPLVAYNREHTGPSEHGKLAVLIQEGGKVTGGLFGRINYRWLHIELLAVPETLRRQGYGSRLLAHAETAARGRECMGVWVDTYDFQAPDFYRRNGYEAFATLPDQPPGGARIFLRKSLI